MNYIYVALVAILTLPVEVFARIEYANPLVGIPGYDGGEASFQDFVNLIYGLSISIAALLAVVKIVIAGIQWMVAGDNASRISNAKTDIQGALVGLIIIISAVLIITVINPTIVGR